MNIWQSPWRKPQDPRGDVDRGYQKDGEQPVYCLDRVSPWIAEPPGPVIPIEQWVAASAKLIEEIGAESYLRLLIQNLKGE